MKIVPATSRATLAHRLAFTRPASVGKREALILTVDFLVGVFQRPLTVALYRTDASTRS
jgi:hypothetical protein